MGCSWRDLDWWMVEGYLGKLQAELREVRQRIEELESKHERLVQAARDEGYVEGWNQASEELELRRALKEGAV